MMARSAAFESVEARQSAAERARSDQATQSGRDFVAPIAQALHAVMAAAIQHRPHASRASARRRHASTLHATRHSRAVSSSRFARIFACLALGMLASVARAGDHRFALLLDVDNTVATGCTLATSKGSVAGIDQVWTAVVTTSTAGATVARVERQTCAGGSLGAAVTQGGGWAVGIGHGISGTAVIEMGVPRAFLPTPATLKASVASVNATGGQDATAAFLVTLAAAPPPPPTGSVVQPVPLSRWLLLVPALLMLVMARRLLRRYPDARLLVVFAVVVTASGLVWAASVVLDGNVDDWQGVVADTGNAEGSAPIDANIVAVFHQSDATNLYLRIDADVRPDAAGNQPPVVAAGADITITLPAAAALNGSVSDDGLPNPPATVTTAWSKQSGPGTVTFGNAGAPATSATFSQSGTYVLRLSASDGALAGSDDVNVTVNTSGDHVPSLAADFAGTSPGVAVTLEVLDNDVDADGDALSVTAFTQGTHGQVACTTSGSCTYTPDAGFSGQDTFGYTVDDGHGGTASATVTVVVAAADTTANAPPVKQGVTSVVGPSTAFLYAGANPLQHGVAPGTIEAARAAVLRGKVTTRGNSLLPGVKVTVVGHPEFGDTTTRSNGYFDMAVNGGGLLTLDFAAAGFLPAQKQVRVPWQDYVVVPTVALIPLDAAVTAMTANAATTQVHRSSVVSDADGSRRVIVVVAPGTTATMTMPDGSTQALATMHVRASEYTVGRNGPAAMPAALPPLSGYTYCVELSIDEALGAGATGVVFSQPVVTYVENFLAFPVGTSVPVGIYDRVKGTWVPSANGRTVRIVDIAGGVANVDTDGDGATDSGLGLTLDERKILASSYAPGQSLWRVAVAHFSPADSNWRFSIPTDATSPGDSGAGPDPNEPLQDPVCHNGSVVECENQVLGETLPIVGTPFTLNYRSDRVPGLVASRTIRLAGASVPASLESIGVHMAVAGRDFEQTFPAAPNQQTTFVWDRQDAYGRTLLGGQTLSVRIDYNYPTTYTDPGPTPAAFNGIGGVSLGANPGRQQVNISQSFTTTIGEGLTDARMIGLGGWTLNVHNIYDPNARVAHFGSGLRRRAGSLARMLTTIDVPGQSVLFDVEVGPDGSKYVALPHGDLIVRIAPDGNESIVAGNGTEGFSGDGGPATQAMLGDPTGIAIGPDGSLYIAEESNFRVRKVAPDGTISTIAGTGVVGFNGDGGAATAAQLSFAERIAVGADSTIYLLDGQRVRRINNDGIITTVAGNGSVGATGDGGPATSASLNASSVVVAPDGGFYIADFGNHRVRRVDAKGIINTVVDYSSEQGQPVSIRPTPDGSLLIALQFTGAATPRVDLLQANGHVITIAGGGPSGIQENIPATQATLPAIRASALAPDGSLIIAPGDASSHLLRISPALPGFEGNGYFIPSTNGAQLMVFDEEGKHLETRNALTGAVLYQFGYDAAGRLTQVIEKTGGTDNVTTIQHDAQGNPTAIVSPFGQVTTLAVDANGFLASVANPAGDTVNITSDAGGLMASFADARGKTSHFAFDADGRLAQDTDPIGGAQSLVRTTGDDQFTVTRTTTLGRVTTYVSQSLPGNSRKRTTIAPDAAQSLSVDTVDAGTMHAVTATGMTTDRVLQPDPRFGMSAPITASTTVQTPAGRSLVASSSLVVTLSSPGDPLSLSSSTSTQTLDGHTTASQYTASTHTFVTTTPAGRTATTTIDDLGRMVASHVPGLNPAVLNYDTRGRLATLTRGSGAEARTLTMAYDAQGFLQAVTDPLGHSAQFTRDAAGRVLAKRFPDGQSVVFAYDAAGNVVSVTPPGRPAYAFAFSDRNELIAATPPAVPGGAAKTQSFDPDRQLTTLSRGDGTTIRLGYDAAGRIASRNVEAGGNTIASDGFGYDASGRVASVTGAAGVTLAYAYDGALFTGTTWSGAIAGSVARDYDGSFRVASETVNGANPIALAYDADDLVIGAGAFAITRDAQNGLPTATSLGVVTTTVAFNGFAEPTSTSASAGGSALLSAVITRDKLGRILRRVETIGGATSTFDYTYDLAGQVTAVARDGAAVEAYGYDANGNRIAATVAGVAQTASYDDQDRLVQYGNVQFAYDGAGDRQTRTDGAQVTQYRYDPFGNLAGVTLADGTDIAYVVDGYDRRVGKRVNGTPVKGFLYADRLRVIAELDGTNGVVARFIYAGGNVPVAMIRGGTTFRMLKDAVGSVRLVVDAATGTIAQRIDYDAFGNVVLDTHPGFQPFGFGGGLYDPDTGLVRLGVRDYDAATGRWTAKDPSGFSGGDANLYRYAHNDPINRVDSTGRDDVSVDAGLAVQDVVNLVAQDPQFVQQTDSVLKYLPGGISGELRNLGFFVCNVFSAGHACDPTDDETASEVCTGIAERAKAVVEQGITSGDLPGVSAVDVLSRRRYGTDHTALIVTLTDGDSVIVDWHATLDPNHPQVKSVDDWCGGKCL